MRKYLRQNKAITLIALVISIIVILILAGVTIASLTGDNGLLARAVSAKEETEKAEGKEEINIAVLGSIKGDGKIDLSMLTDNLSRITGLTDKNGNQINSTNPVTALPITVKRNNKYTYKITGDGEVENKKQVVMPEGIKVGDAVTYEPTGSTYTWRGKYATTAAIKEDGISTDDDVVLNSTSGGADRIITWKVFKIDEEEGEIQLVPTETKTAVLLQGTPGYNNAVQLLDEACRTLYSDSSKGITAENIDMDDIEPLLDEEKLQAEKNKYNHNSKSHLVERENEEYDQVKNAYGKNYSYFPRIYEEEKYSVINGNKKTTGLGLSSPGSKLYERDEATSLTNQTTATNANTGYLQANTSIQPYQTYYDLNSLRTAGNYADSATSSAYASMLNKTYWVASRCVYTSSSYCDFFVRYVDSGRLERQLFVPLGQ